MKITQKLTGLVFLLLALFTFEAVAQTLTPPATGNPDDTYNWLVTLNNKMLGAPAGVLVLVVVFLFDSVLYYAEFFPNRNIPVFSFAAGALIYALISVKGDSTLPTHVWIAKNVVFGCIAGGAAWVLSLRYGMKLVLKVAGKPDPAPPLPEPVAPAPAQTMKVELEVHSEKPAPTNLTPPPV